MKDKNSFLLYKDLIHTVKKLPKDSQAELFMHILEYVNDKNPVTDNVLVDLTFEPIKHQLKRDLVKWIDTKAVKSKAGKASAEARKIKKEAQQVLTDSTGVKSVQHNPTDSTQSTVSVNVTVTDTVSVNDIIKEKMKKETYPLFQKWLDYRKAIKKPVKVEQTLKALANRFNTEPIDKIKWVVTHSIENNYQGLFWDKFKKIKINNNGQIDSDSTIREFIGD